MNSGDDCVIRARAPVQTGGCAVHRRDVPKVQRSRLLEHEFAELLVERVPA